MTAIRVAIEPAQPVHRAAHRLNPYAGISRSRLTPRLAQGCDGDVMAAGGKLPAQILNRSLFPADDRRVGLREHQDPHRGNPRAVYAGAISEPTRTGRLRVLMVTPRSPLGQGGSERHVMEVSRRLAAAGVEVQVLCADSPGPPVVENHRNGVTIRSVRSWPADRDYYLAPGIWREMARERWDIVHIQSYHTLVPPLAMLRALTLAVPYVVTFHSGGHSSRLRHRLRRAQRRVLRPLLSRAARLIAVARFEIDLYGNELHLPAEKFALIPNGVDIEFGGNPGVEGPKGSSDIDAEGPLLASIGRLERYKNHQRVIAALPHVLERHPDARLIIVGTGPYETTLRRQVAELGLADRVEFTSLPAEDRDGMARLLRRTSIVVLLSDFETHPLVALEAVSAGRRLLVADRAGLGELARDGIARSVSPQDPPEAVGRAIADELQRPAPRQQALSLPTWEECAEQLLALYRDVNETAHDDRTDVQKSPRA